MAPFGPVPFDMYPLSPPSPYAHVFQTGQPKTRWPKLDDDESLSMLHDKCWGKDISDERRKWLGTQSRGHQMDTDETSAGFALYLDIKALNQGSMWVREDYVLLYNDCTAHFNDPMVLSGSKPPSVVITGQPGVGK